MQLKDDRYELVIGLEIHAQLLTESKMFSSSKNQSGDLPNYNVSEIDMSMPGTLPSFNKKCLELAVRAGLGLNCTIHKYSAFDRKHYFYPDLPNGYQISQFYYPIATKGYIMIEDEKISITRIHMENDAGKSIHDNNFSLIDLNRSGVGLIEIVTDPVIYSPMTAGLVVRKIRDILKSLDVCNGDLEKGALRCDANVSVKLKNTIVLGNRCEIKNLNSYRNIEKAIIYEANRQIDLLNNNQEVVQSTMLFDADEEKTYPIRTKEDALDYRYFQDPDLRPIIIDDHYIELVKKNMPEVISYKIARYINDYNISEYEANILASDKYVSQYFEDITKSFSNYSLISSWIIGELFSILNKNEIEFKDNPISSDHFLELLIMMNNAHISGKIAKSVLKYMYEENKSPKIIVKEKDLQQITDESILKDIISTIMNENEQIVSDYRAGKTKVFASLIGIVMKKTNGKANPEIANKILLNLLK